MKNRFFNIIAVCLVLIFTAFLILKPEPCREGIANGILLCGRIIIPSLFPFTMCVLFIMKSGIFERLEPLSPVTNKIFALSGELFSVMLLSLIGGYPVGAKLLGELVKSKKITAESGGLMLNYCINAGPAFIISAVGSGILGSQLIGAVLLASHISASLILCFFSRFHKKTVPAAASTNTTQLSLADNFVLSASEAAASVFSICVFVILFSGINSYISLLSAEFKELGCLSYILEVTNAVTHTSNVYLISFLLGFGGLSVWCQILAVGRDLKINITLFIISRLLHGALSLLITAFIIKAFKISLPTLSNGKVFDFSLFHSTPALAISMLMTAIIFIISVSGKLSFFKIIRDSNP